MGVSVKEEAIVGFEDATEDDSGGKKKKSSKKSGGFQSMGLSFPVLKGITKRGYKVPTPIQRKTIPLVLEGRDVVAMARTGSGKTACFLIPMFEKLRIHNTKQGVRALILSPTRELALQTHKFTKQIGKFTGLRSAVVLGGDSMENQFSSLHDNPDIVIATPGRFLHICVEMDLKLNSVQYIVFDEADRLFEMGFGEQLHEIVQRLPESRQTLLFSATLPKVLVEFARAGLSDPVLIRLDVESKLPDTLKTTFISCRPEEKPAGLLCLLKYVIKPKSQTIIFAATKHHVEYIHALLRTAGISSSYIYSDLDASARKINVAKFQTGKVSTLVVTDIAARGIDIPQLDNVINYNFPAKGKLFVHRVGRCARAGRSGIAYCLVSSDEVCYMLDLHLFLGRPLTLVPPVGPSPSTDDTSFGKIPQHILESELSQIINWQTDTSDLVSLLQVSENAYKQYIRSRPGASVESVRRSKDIKTVGDHPLFVDQANGVKIKQEDPEIAISRASLVAEINSYKPHGTIFEVGQCSKSDMYTVMKKKRERDNTKIAMFKKKQQEKEELTPGPSNQPDIKLELSQPEDVVSTFSKVVMEKRKSNMSGLPKAKRPCTVDKDNYIPYRPLDLHTEQGLAVNNFQRDASAAGLDMTADTESTLKSSIQRKVWDKKKKKMVGVNFDSKAGKIKSESGAWIPATYKSGRYKQWTEKMKTPATTSFIVDEEEDTESKTIKLNCPNTHWGRHNMKMAQRKVKSDLRRPEQILKEREKKEKRRRHNGRKHTKKKQ